MNIGDKAPEFLGLNEKGEEIRLSNYKGRKIVLYFYPKDMTSGCTAQACNLRDNYEELRKQGYEVIGVSINDQNRIRNLSRKIHCRLHSLPIPSRNWYRNLAYGAKRACMEESTWAPSVQPLLSTKKESLNGSFCLRKSRPRIMPHRF